MDWFDILIGISSVGSFIVAVIALLKMHKIQKVLQNDNSNKSKQVIEKTEIQNSNVKQVGRDYGGE